MEVMVSALLIALVVVGTFSGFDVSNRTTGDERSHAEADGLAQQDEERMRSLGVGQLTHLSESREVTYNGTHYTIKSSAKFISDETGSESCSAESANADYIQTTSEVGWPALKTRPKVVETGLIAPRLGGSLLTQVLEANGKGVAGMTVTATGPAPSVGVETGITDSNGCVIFGSVEPGEYKVTTHQAGYVEKDGNSEPPTTEQAATVINGSTTKKEFLFGRAGSIEVTYAPSGATNDTWVAFETEMTTFRKFGTEKTYTTTSTTPTTMFPFTSAYAVYAGTCEANNPETVSAIKPAQSLVVGGSVTKTTVTVPPVSIKVMSGKSSASPGKAIQNAVVRLEDTGCKTAETGKTTSTGAMEHPNVPYGKYSLCVTGGTTGGNNGGTNGLGKERKYTTTFNNDTTTGPSTLTAGTMTNGGTNASKEAVIYLESGAATSPGTLGAGSTCP
ncbi:MAG: hypothetical protein ACYDHN_08020 [Solirubrobacteraceae bacterium]